MTLVGLGAPERPTRLGVGWVARGCGLALALLMVLGSAARAAIAADAEWLPETQAPSTARATAPQTTRWLLDLGVDAARGRRHGDMGVDLLLNQRLAPDWLVGLSGRIDVDADPGFGLSSKNLSLSLRELFVRHEAGTTTVDLGRISVRDGVALGYNPSDVFRDGALQTFRTRDPQRLRESRLGVVALRAMAHIGTTELAALASPALPTPSAPAWYEPRWGAVNGGQSQVTLKLTPPRWNNLYSNLLWQRLQDGRQTWGLNLSRALGQSAVAYAELARSRRADVLALAVASTSAQPTSTAGVGQWAMGLNYSTEQRQTFTMEWQHNGAGLSRSDWLGAWQQLAPQAVTSARVRASQGSDPLGRDSLMLALQWDRFGRRDADLSCLVRANLVDGSRLGWCEWRYKQPAAEWSVNLARTTGRERSEFGAVAQPWALGLRWRVFL